MQQFRLDFSPIVYYTSEKNCGEWILFLHAAFVNHKMFQPQIENFENKYNIPQPTAAIKPKSKKEKRIILFVDARAIMHIYGILYQINRELNSPASIHTKG